MSAAVQSSQSATSAIQETLHVYTRVSTQKQKDDGTSLETQEELGRKRAKDLGFNFKLWDEGDASSHHDAIRDRPVLARLFAAIEAGHVKHLWIGDASRSARKDNVASTLRYACQKNGVVLYTTDGVLNLSKPSDLFLKQLLDGVAEYENALRMERTRLGKLSRVRGGYWHGGPPPFGYEIQDKKLVERESEARWVKRIFKEIIKKKSVASIKKTLDEHGVLSRRGKLWSLGSINAVVGNTHYDGFYQFTDKKTGETVKVLCPRIVDNLTWVTAQQVRAESAKRQLQRNATTTHFYLLRDFMHCAHCGRQLSGRRTAQGVATYFCPNKEREWAKKGGSATPWQRGKTCGFTRSMNIERTDKIVWDFVKSVHRNSCKLKEDVKNRVLKAHGLVVMTAAETAKLEKSLKKLQGDHDKLSELLAKLEVNHELKIVSDARYKVMARTLNEDLAKLDERIALGRAEMTGAAQAGKWVDWLSEFGSEVDKVDQRSEQGKKEYLEGLVERIDVRCNEAAKEHELTIRMKFPIIGDKIDYTGKTVHGRKEYRVLNGTDQETLKVQKKDQRGWN
jgi:DNA invertase Pin-like site-specific DNA recombinase